jgi:hypothetical protein
VPLTKEEITLDITLRAGKEFRDNFGDLINTDISIKAKSKRKNIKNEEK